MKRLNLAAHGREDHCHTTFSGFIFKNDRSLKQLLDKRITTTNLSIFVACVTFE